MTFTLQIQLGNEAMSDATQLAAALRRVAEKIDSFSELDIFIVRPRGIITDLNGNSVGSYEMVGH